MTTDRAICAVSKTVPAQMANPNLVTDVAQISRYLTLALQVATRMANCNTKGLDLSMYGNPHKL